jgi:hypothetical protein
MNRQSVTSSNIEAIGYSEEDNILEVEFHDGSVYQYLEVPKDIYDGLMSASSHGTYLNEHVKKVYNFRKIQ